MGGGVVNLMKITQMHSKDLLQTSAFCFLWLCSKNGHKPKKNKTKPAPRLSGLLPLLLLVFCRCLQNNGHKPKKKTKKKQKKTKKTKPAPRLSGLLPLLPLVFLGFFGFFGFFGLCPLFRRQRQKTKRSRGFKVKCSSFHIKKNLLLIKVSFHNQIFFS